LNKQGLLEPTKLNCGKVLNELRQKLNQGPDDDDWVRWGRWFLADPATRTISPFSKVTVPEYVEARIIENTAASGAEAERLASGNAELTKRIARARKTLEQLNRANTLRKEADALSAKDKMPEAESKYAEALEILRQVNGLENADTLKMMKSLADSFYSLGRGKEAIPLLAQACELDPKDTISSLRLATWQAWFGQDADYEATRRRLVQQAEGTDQAGTAERAAKAACLGPSNDDALLAKTLALAQQGVELGKSSSVLPWYQVALGMAEYRNGQYTAAGQTLAVAEQKFENLDSPHLLGIARLFHVMSLHRQGQTEEARRLFIQAVAQMPPFPQDELKPFVNGKPATHDYLICWLAYKEAQSVLNEPGHLKP